MKRTNHYYFACPNCPADIWLPSERLGYIFHAPAHRTIDAPALGFPCRRCSYLGTYSLHRDSPFFGKRDGSHWSDPAIFGETEFLGWLRCAVGDCKSPLPLFAQWSATTTAEERRANIETWRWENLKCPQEHPIFRQRPSSDP